MADTSGSRDQAVLQLINWEEAHLDAFGDPQGRTH